MSRWPATKAQRVLAALERAGWRIARTRGSHKLLMRQGSRPFWFTFHESVEVARKQWPGSGRRRASHLKTFDSWFLVTVPLSAFILEKTRLTPDRTLANLTADEFVKLLAAIQSFEGWKEGKIVAGG